MISVWYRCGIVVVLVRYLYGIGAVCMCYRYVSVLYICSIGAVSVQCLYGIGVVLVRYLCGIREVSVQHRCDVGVVLVRYLYSIGVISTRYRCGIRAVSMWYQCSIDAVSVRYRCGIYAVWVWYRCSIRLVSVGHLYGNVPYGVCTGSVQYVVVICSANGATSIQTVSDRIALLHRSSSIKGVVPKGATSTGEWIMYWRSCGSYGTGFGRRGQLKA